jgi:putative SOS response-associated peptidase YedK
MLRGSVSLDLPFEARYNIAPSQNVEVIADFGRGPERRSMVWGLIPSWSSDGKGLINARAETLEDKPSFADSFRLRRCLIPADGFFEWRRSGRSKQPFYIQMKDASLFAFAGIWDIWRKGDLAIWSCAIITTVPNELVAELHDRMPVILQADGYDAWLDRRTDSVQLREMLRAVPASEMKMHSVTAAINHPENDFADLLARVDFESGTTPSLF